ncbi:MAG: RHS repeat protein [Gammaproteobacteria bacterium]
MNTNRQGTALISRFAYDYDPNGNRTQQTETNGGADEETTYTYDDNDRLQSIEHPDTTITYSYDATTGKTKWLLKKPPPAPSPISCRLM